MNKIIKVTVRAGSGKQEIKNRDDELIVSLKSPAHNGKANKELLKLVKNYFKKYQINNIRIVKGLKNKNKLIEIKW